MRGKRRSQRGTWASVPGVAREFRHKSGVFTPYCAEVRLLLPASTEAKTRTCAGTSGSGETRTRTGDTTIFSRAALRAESGQFAGDSRPPPMFSRVRVFPDFAFVWSTLRQTARVVCLFIAGHPGLLPVCCCDRD